MIYFHILCNSFDGIAKLGECLEKEGGLNGIFLDFSYTLINFLAVGAMASLPEEIERLRFVL